MKQTNKIFYDAILKAGLLDLALLQNYLAQAEVTNLPLRDFLISKNILTEEQILQALSRLTAIEIVSLRTAQIERSVIERVPIKIAWYYKFVPIAYQSQLTIACAVPFDVKTLDEIRMHLNVPVKIVLASENEILESLKKFYGFASNTIDKILSREVKKTSPYNKESEWIEDLEQKSDDPTVANLVNQIILEAYKKRATDVHIEPYRDKVRFRYRIDGVLVDANVADDVKHFIQPILSRIKILANLSITEKRLPQDGSAVVKTKDQTLDLRVSTMPTAHGESLVIRILPSKVMLFSLEKLGFNSSSVNRFRELIKKPHGIIFITGPTGSGKTTTLYACLNEISSAERKIITLEDPIEYEMEGITQIQVNPKINFSFAAGLRSVLRHDPDIVMVGEVRDYETAEIAIRTALTGHLVFSTLHTNDAASGITRLIDMGIEPYLVASSVEAFIAQRLVRVICPKCKEETKSPQVGVKEEIAKTLNIAHPEDVKIYRGKGCDFCNHTGYYGRTAIYETLTINDAIQAAIIEKPRSDYIKKIAIQTGFVTLRQNGWKAVVDGITTPSEVMNVTVSDSFGESFVETVSLSAVKETGGSKKREVRETRKIKIERKGAWAKTNQYESRIYARAFEPVDIRYKIIEQDPQDDTSLITDGIIYPTKTEDISAGGLRFTSKSVVPLGSILELSIQLGGSQKTINCLARVCRIEEDALEHIYTIVAYYLDISSADRVTINKFAEEKVKQDVPQISENADLTKTAL